jgi:endonuclease/exonuclease/phosphatase family metal-dependent hydrolase
MPASLRVLTYNIRHGLGLDDQVSLERIAWNILISKADICGIQEVDRFLPRSGLNNQAKGLAKLCNMNYAYGANMRWAHFSAYGNAILSRYPIVNAHNYPLPGTGEKRGVLRTTIVKNGMAIDFLTTHLTLIAEERVTQAEFISNLLDTIKGSVILTGDFNEEAAGRAVNLLTSTGMLHCLPGNVTAIPTYPALNPQKQIDFIFAKGQWEVSYGKALKSKASDHLPYLVEIEKTGD